VGRRVGSEEEEEEGQEGEEGEGEVEGGSDGMSEGADSDLVVKLSRRGGDSFLATGAHCLPLKRQHGLPRRLLYLRPRRVFFGLSAALATPESSGEESTSRRGRALGEMRRKGMGEGEEGGGEGQGPGSGSRGRTGGVPGDLAGAHPRLDASGSTQSNSNSTDAGSSSALPLTPIPGNPSTSPGVPSAVAPLLRRREGG